MSAALKCSHQQAFVRRLIDDVMNAQRLDVADELCTPRMARRWRAWVAPFLASFPDVRMALVQLVDRADRLRELHERQDPLLHAGTARRRDGQ